MTKDIFLRNTNAPYRRYLHAFAPDFADGAGPLLRSPGAFGQTAGDRIRTQMTHEISVVMALKHPLAALGVRAALGSRQDINIVAECSTLAGATRALKRYRPLVLILEVSLTEARAGDLESLTRAFSQTRVALLCVGPAEFDGRVLFEGARAVLPPDTEPQQLVDCVCALAAGKRWRTPLRVHDYRGPSAAPGAPMPGTALRVLSARERQIAEGIASGKRNREIANALGITVGTVKLHVSRIFEKVHVNSRLALLRKIMIEEQGRR